MDERSASEALVELVDGVLPAVVRETAQTQAGGLHRAVMGLVERLLLRHALELSGGNQLHAARLLGINRNTLRKRLVLLGLRPRTSPSPAPAEKTTL